MENKQKILQAPLEAHEIDFRVQSINNGGYALILPYKNARVDMHRLNRAFGVGGWQREHEVLNGRLYCSVGIWNETINQWCWVQDVGTESNTEKEKGQASDSFKRACFNLGIGIELYDYPEISVKLNANEWVKGNGNSANKATWEFQLKLWRWVIQMEDGLPSFIGARDQNGKLRYKLGTLKQEKAA